MSSRTSLFRAVGPLLAALAIGLLPVAPAAADPGPAGGGIAGVGIVLSEPLTVLADGPAPRRGETTTPGPLPVADGQPGDLRASTRRELGPSETIVVELHTTPSVTGCTARPELVPPATECTVRAGEPVEVNIIARAFVEETAAPRPVTVLVRPLPPGASLRRVTADGREVDGPVAGLGEVQGRLRLVAGSLTVTPDNQPLIFEFTATTAQGELVAAAAGQLRLHVRPAPQLQATVTTNRGCGAGAAFGVGEPIEAHLRADGAEIVEMTVQDVLPDGRVVTLVDGATVPGGLTLVLRGTVAEPAGTEALRVIARAGGQEAVAECTFVVTDAPGIPVPPPDAPTPPRCPVVLIPGSLGTRIVATANFRTAEGVTFQPGEEVWGRRIHDTQEPYLGLEFTPALEPRYPTDVPGGNSPLMNPMLDGVDAYILGRKVSSTPVYEGFHRYFEDRGYRFGVDLFAFGWDWRRGAGAPRPGDGYLYVARLDEFIEDVRRHTRAQRVCLVAHSQGGYVAWLYLANQPNVADKVQAVVTIGTPYLGSPKATAALGWGVNYGDVFLGMQFGPDPATVRRMSAHMPGVGELLPSTVPPLWASWRHYSGRLASGTSYSRDNMAVARFEIVPRAGNRNAVAAAVAFHAALYRILVAGPPTGVPVVIVAGSGVPSWRWIYSDGWARRVTAHLNETGDETVPTTSHAAWNVVPATVPRIFTHDQNHVQSMQGGAAMAVAYNVVRGLEPLTTVPAADARCCSARRPCRAATWPSPCGPTCRRSMLWPTCGGSCTCSSATCPRRQPAGRGCWPTARRCAGTPRPTTGWTWPSSRCGRPGSRRPGPHRARRRAGSRGSARRWSSTAVTSWPTPTTTGCWSCASIWPGASSAAWPGWRPSRRPPGSRRRPWRRPSGCFRATRCARRRTAC
jgi:pimeloyl-ACP methyl ester carboxylesterase